MYILLIAGVSVHASTQAQNPQPSVLQPHKNPSEVPQRIVSINLCIDQLLWQLVSHERLVSLSYLSAEPLWSPIATQVKNMPLNHALAEEIIPLHADKILVMPFDSPASVQLLKRLGEPVEPVLLPNSLAEISQQIMQVATMVGAENKAQLLLQQIDRPLQALDELKAQHHPRTAFWYSSNGVVIGSGTLEHELMTRAGLRNLAAEQGIEGFTPLDIELLITAKPDLLIMEESNSDVFSLAREYLSHPALAHSSMKIIHLPAGLSGCAATTVGEVANVLQRELQ